MSLRVASLVVLVAVAGAAAPPDAGTSLTSAECSALLDAMMQMAVTESLAADAELKRLPADLRTSTEKQAREKALADPKLEELKAACPKRYTRAQRECILAAKSMAAIDACAKQ